MGNLSVQIRCMEEQAVYGIWRKSNDRTVSADIGAASKQYHSDAGRPDGGVLPFYVLSRNYDGRSRDFELFIGGTLKREGLDRLELPAGEYAVISVRPKLGFLWGAAVGEAKRYFYTKWLPESQYQGLNMEYEFHTEKSAGAHPEIEIVFAVRKK